MARLLAVHEDPPSLRIFEDELKRGDSYPLAIPNRQDRLICIPKGFVTGYSDTWLWCGFWWMDSVCCIAGPSWRRAGRGIPHLLAMS